MQEFRHGLEQIYGSRLVRVVLFGSQARDEAEPDSDIDVMVVLRGPVNPHEEIRRLSAFKSELCLKYDVVVSCVYVSESEFTQDGTPLMLNVRREAISRIGRPSRAPQLTTAVGDHVAEFHGAAGREVLGSFHEYSEDKHRKAHHDSSPAILKSRGNR